MSRRHGGGQEGREEGPAGGRERIILGKNSQTKHSYHQLSMSGAQAFRTMGKEDGEEGGGLVCPEPAFHCRLRN